MCRVCQPPGTGRRLGHPGGPATASSFAAKCVPCFLTVQAQIADSRPCGCCDRRRYVRPRTCDGARPLPCPAFTFWDTLRWPLPSFVSVVTAGVGQTTPHLRVQKLWLVVALLPTPVYRRTAPAWWRDLEGTARRWPVAEMSRWRRSPLRDTGAAGTEPLSKESPHGRP